MLNKIYGKWDLRSLKDTQNHAYLLARKIKSPALILLEGELGAGKTEWARCFIRSYLSKPSVIVSSPTYSLLNSYKSGRKQVWHGDLYRLKQTGEIDDLGLNELIMQNNILCLEWAKKHFLNYHFEKRKKILIQIEFKNQNLRTLTCELLRGSS